MSSSNEKLLFLDTTPPPSVYHIWNFSPALLCQSEIPRRRLPRLFEDSFQNLVIPDTLPCYVSLFCLHFCSVSVWCTALLLDLAFGPSVAFVIVLIMSLSRAKRQSISYKTISKLLSQQLGGCGTLALQGDSELEFKPSNLQTPNGQQCSHYVLNSPRCCNANGNIDHGLESGQFE